MNQQDTNCTIRIERDVNIHFEDRKRSAHFFWFMWLIYAVVSMTKNCFSAAMADIVSDGFMLKSQTELITSVFYLVYTPLQVVGGICSDKFSPERMIKIGLIGGGIANTSIFLFNTLSSDIGIIYPAMMASWIFNAIVQFAIWSSVFKVVSSQCVRSERPRMIFLISLAPSAGFLLSYTIGAILSDWRMNFSISAVALFALAVMLHFYDRHMDKYMKWDKVVPVTAKSTANAPKVSTFKLFLTSGYILLLVAVFLRDSVTATMRRISATMLNETFEVGPSIGNLMSTLIVGACVIGIVASRELVQHKIVKNHVFGILVGLGITSVFTILFIFAPSIATNVICMCLIAGITSATTLFTTTISSAYVRYGKNGTAAGILNAAVSFGYITPLLAVIIEEQSNWNVVKIAIAGMAVLSVIVTLFVLPMYNRFIKREQEEDRLAEEAKASTSADA